MSEAGTRWRTVVGLNTGTSMDGVDALCVRMRGHGIGLEVEKLAWVDQPLPSDLRAVLLRAPDLHMVEMARADVALAEVLAEAALEAARRAGIAPHRLDLVASHGQTVYHEGRGAGEGAVSLQIGSLDILAERCGCLVAGDFRRRDAACGGQAAPLMPYLDHALFAASGRVTTLNLGGVAALTFVDEVLDRCRAHDAGPANLPLDGLAGRHPEGGSGYDPDGVIAARGRIDADLLAELNAHPYLARPAPKTAGREEFGPAFVDGLLERRSRCPLEDLLATTTRWVAEVIAAEVRAAGRGAACERLVASGGGVRNQTLMGHLRELLPAMSVEVFAERGVEADAKEALLFATLGHARLDGIPSSVPGATGARGARCLGHLVLPA